MKVYTVGQVNHYLADLVGSDYLLQRILIKGEISNCKYHSMGHIYFTLKDESGSMPCVMFKGNQAAGLSFRLEDGQAVLVEGSVRVYEKDARVSLYARKVQMDGDGTGRLRVLYEQLKQRLFDEGLFDFEKKKPIPAYPKRVGIVTASTGAAIRDICNVANRRNPYVELILYPAKVQGEGAAATIAEGIRTLDRMGLDTIIIGRGGGSIEDLWAFNEEIVARAIYEAKTPIISGTGHETDNTIADYAADRRAPTPSAAAELAIPDVMTTLRRIREMRDTLDRQILSRKRLLDAKLDNLKNRLEHAGPNGRLKDQRQRMLILQDRLHRAIRQSYEASSLTQERLAERLRRDMDSKLQMTRQRAAILTERLNGLSPTAKLRGGFGYISRDGAAVRSVQDVNAKDLLEIVLHDGTIEAEVVGKNEQTI